jgi:hypothetical protein
MAVVALTLAPPEGVSRTSVLLRLVAAPLLGVVGPLPLWPAAVTHVALPIVAALHLRRDRAAYCREDAPRVAEGLAWLVALYAWAALVAGAPPPPGGSGGVRLELRPAPPPSPGAALLRVATGLPATLGLLIAGALALLPWLAAVVAALVTGRPPMVLWRPLAALTRHHAGHLCRQASLTGRRA